MHGWMSARGDERGTDAYERGVWEVFGVNWEVLLVGIAGTYGLD